MTLSWANTITPDHRGFTIVELLVVVVVIGILASITIVSYNGITKAAEESVLKTNLSTLQKQMQIASITAGGGISASSIQENLYKESSGTITQYRYGTTDSYCVDSTGKSGSVFHLNTADGNSTIQENGCPAITNTIVQTVCLGSEAYVKPRQVNYTSETLSITLETPYGSSTSDVSPGSSKFQNFGSNASSFGRGFITSRLSGKNGSTFSATYYVAYEPKSC